MRWLLLAALSCSYFGSLWAGALHFPHGYDWRRNVISNLLSPRDNPQWYWLPSAGVAMAGLLMLPLAVWIDSELAGGESRLARWTRRSTFLAGAGCLVLSAIVVPQHVHTVMGLRHAHELLARSAAVGLGLGMLCACQSAALGGGAPPERRKRLRALRIIWWAATAPPISGAIASGLMVALAHFHILPAGPAAYLRGTVFWRLAFWEWAGSVGVFVFFAGAAAMLGREQ